MAGKAWFVPLDSAPVWYFRLGNMSHNRGQLISGVWLPFFKKNGIYFYFWLCWVCLAEVWPLLQLQQVGATLQLQCVGFSLWWLILLPSTGSRGAGFSKCSSRALAHRLNSWRRMGLVAVCGICPDQGSNPCLLHWQADSLPLSHQGSPGLWFWSLGKSIPYWPSWAPLRVGTVHSRWQKNLHLAL